MDHVRDVNVEHLLDIFTSIDADSKNVWDVCATFMNHLYWHKLRHVTLGPKIEALLDEHPSKPRCLWSLSSLFNSVGNLVESKRIITHSLKLVRERGDDFQVAATLCALSAINLDMDHHKERTEQAKEALEIYERLGYVAAQAWCLISLARLLARDGQLDATEKTASRAVNLLPEKGEELQVCEGHSILGNIYFRKGDTEKAIHHFEISLATASSLNFYRELFWAHSFLADLFSAEGRLEDAHAHVEQAKPHAVNNPYLLAQASRLQARFWYEQDMLEEAKSEALRALNKFEKFGVALDVEKTRELLEEIDHNARGNGLGSSHT